VGEQFQLGLALVAQPGLGRVEMNAAPQRWQDQEVLIMFISVSPFGGGAGCPCSSGAPRALSGR
jgi:hypothetical protein